MQRAFWSFGDAKEFKFYRSENIFIYSNSMMRLIEGTKYCSFCSMF